MSIRSLLANAGLGIGVIVFTGCASLSEKQCRSGDWSGIGYRDGASGHTEYRINDHEKACGKHGIVPDAREYEAGRQRGLERYCTVSGGLNAGRNGGSYAGVCPPALEPAFLRAFQLGTDINRVEAQLNAVRGERSSIYHRLHEMDEAGRDEHREDRRDGPDRDRNEDRRDERRDEREERRDERHDERERDTLMFRLRELERAELQLNDEYSHLEWEARRLVK